MRRRLALAVVGAGALVAVAPTRVSGAGQAFDLSETLMIERQEGRLVRGVDQFTSIEVVLRRR